MSLTISNDHRVSNLFLPLYWPIVMLTRLLEYAILLLPTGIGLRFVLSAVGTVENIVVDNVVSSSSSGATTSSIIDKIDGVISLGMVWFTYSWVMSFMKVRLQPPSFYTRTGFADDFGTCFALT